MKFLIFLSIFTLIHIKSQIECIECNFMVIENKHYGCEVLKDLWNQTQELITGKHNEGKTDDDVTAMFINAKSDWEYSPIYCRNFINLQRIHIERVETIKRDDFLYCKKAEHLLIVGTDLWWLPEDIFTPMENLKIIEISMNKIVYLPRNLLSNNRRLEKFTFDDNKIQVVDLQFPSSLKEVSLLANQCIDRSVPSNHAKTIAEFNRIVAQKCGSSTANRVRELEWRIRNKNLDPEVTIEPYGYFPDPALEIENYKNWFVFLTCMCAFLVLGWAGTAFILIKKMNDITHGDQHYLVSMDTNNRREFLEEE